MHSQIQTFIQHMHKIIQNKKLMYRFISKFIKVPFADLRRLAEGPPSARSLRAIAKPAR